MRRWLVLLVVVVATAVSAGAVSPAGAAVAGKNASAKTCPAKFVTATFPWGVRCIRGGQYCKKVRNPEYHKYDFQCVNGKLRHQPKIKPKPPKK